jgi:transcriptional regulator with XRE-family HTH domain
MHSNIQPMHIGQVIRAIREARKATLEEIAFAADTNASNLSRIERGVQGYSAETLERIANALGVTVAELHLRVDDSATSTTPGQKKQKSQASNAIISRYAALSPENQELADEFMALLLRRQKSPNKRA